MSSLVAEPAVSIEARKARKPRPKTARRIRILEQPAADTDFWGAIEIALTSGIRSPKTDRTVYLVHFIASDFGHGAIGFELEKLDANLAAVETYHVHLSSNPADRSCTCKSHERHRRCEHRDGIEALVKAGQLKPRFRSAGDMAANDPAGFDRHLDSIAGIAGFGVPPGGGEYPDEPPQLDEGAYFDPADEDIHVA